MLAALLHGQAFEHRMRSGAPRARRAINTTTFESKGGRVECHGQAKQRPIAEARVGTLLEVSEKPSVDASSFGQLFRAQAQFGPAMRNASGQIAHQHSSGPRGRLSTVRSGNRSDVPSFLSGSVRCHPSSVRLTCTGPIGT